MEPSRITQSLNKSLHYHPESYWCADCWKFTLDCSHLAESLPGPHVKLSGGSLVEAAYDRLRHILEVRTNTGEGFQYHGVSLQLAREFAKAPIPSAFLSERIPKAKFERVRGRLRRPQRA